MYPVELSASISDAKTVLDPNSCLVADFTHTHTHTHTYIYIYIYIRSMVVACVASKVTVAAHDTPIIGKLASKI